MARPDDAHRAIALRVADIVGNQPRVRDEKRWADAFYDIALIVEDPDHGPTKSELVRFKTADSGSREADDGR